MASLKEIKGRIASVKSTLKITSAMKLVASAKLRKAQNAIENMLPYEKLLRRTLSRLTGGQSFSGPGAVDGAERAVALVAIASNSSLCGGFNANVIKAVAARADEIRKEGCDVTVFSVGRKMADAMKKAGFASPLDLNKLCADPHYDACATFADELIEAFNSGKFVRIELIYNHFVNAASQKVLVETYLPFVMNACDSVDEASDIEYIVEPSRDSVLEELLPKVLKLKVFTVLLDSVAAEHAARTLAMQTATDNGEDLLQELSLEYNKGRQQKITAEILDLVGGQQE